MASNNTKPEQGEIEIMRAATVLGVAALTFAQLFATSESTVGKCADAAFAAGEAFADEAAARGYDLASIATKVGQLG